MTLHAEFDVGSRLCGLFSMDGGALPVCTYILELVVLIDTLTGVAVMTMRVCIRDWVGRPGSGTRRTVMGRSACGVAM